MSNAMPMAYYLPTTGNAVFLTDLMALVILWCVALAVWSALK